eukprot:1446461-Alexandrium_andersonii.AAC.3
MAWLGLAWPSWLDLWCLVRIGHGAASRVLASGRLARLGLVCLGMTWLGQAAPVWPVSGWLVLDWPCFDLV